MYYWSASIDMIEDYQIYLDYNDASLENKIFFNCTSSNFGSQCQYQVPFHQSDYSTLYELTKLVYISLNGYIRTLTCYTHLQCDRGTESLCLDWTDICNGVINCLNNAVDEKDCWQLEVNQCHEDEHRCQIGQCIQNYFLNILQLHLIVSINKQIVIMNKMHMTAALFMKQDLHVLIR